MKKVKVILALMAVLFLTFSPLAICFADAPEDNHWVREVRYDEGLEEYYIAYIEVSAEEYHRIYEPYDNLSDESVLALYKDGIDVFGETASIKEEIQEGYDDIESEIASTTDSLIEGINEATAIVDEVTEKVTDIENNWQDYVAEKVMPTAAAAISAGAALYVSLSPLLLKVKKASERFNDASDKVEDATNATNESTEKINTFKVELKEELQKALLNLLKKVETLDADVENMKCQINNIESIERIGFCNLEELVVNGKAKEIQKVGTNEEENVECSET